MLDNSPNQPSKFRTKNWIEISDDARGTYNTNSQIKFKTSMIKSSLCHYSDAYIPVTGTISIAEQAGDNPNNNNKEKVFQNYAPFTDCINKINNTQIDNAENIDVVMPLYNLLDYSKTSGSLWQYYRDEPALTDAGAIALMLITVLHLKLRKNKAGAANCRKNLEVIVSLKYLSNFWRTLAMSLINCEINLILTWSEKCVLSNDTKATIKLYVAAVTLSSQDKEELLQQ